MASVAVAAVVVVAVFVFADAAVVQNGAVRAALFVRGVEVGGGVEFGLCYPGAVPGGVGFGGAV
jgi:hypothetical protein